MKMYELTIISTNEISGECFEREAGTILLNLDHVSEITGILDFTLPFSGKTVGRYGSVRMNNGFIYFAIGEEIEQLKLFLNQFTMNSESNDDDIHYVVVNLDSNRLLSYWKTEEEVNKASKGYTCNVCCTQMSTDELFAELNKQYKDTVNEELNK